MSDLQAYLASKYLSGAKADAILARTEDGKRKKKKRKVDSTHSTTDSTSNYGTGLVIADEDDFGQAIIDEEDDTVNAVVETKRGEFKGKGAASWQTIRPPESGAPEQPIAEQVPDDEKPVVVQQDDAPPKPRGGLQSAADLKAENERRLAEQAKRKAEAERAIAQRKAERAANGEEDDDEDDPHATVYRDASGKRIDVKLQKAELAKQKREELEKEMARMEWGKGLVQKEDKQRQREEAEKLKNRPMARYADDQDMNDELREQERWNDPAAAFLTKKKKDKGGRLGFPKYAGPPPPPNRFGIPPGYRWDGVDRSNGFERKWMQAQNERRARASQTYAYSSADM